MNKTIAVLAGNYLQFLEYKKENEDKKLVFCDAWPNFAGFEFSDFVEIGTFRNRKDALELFSSVLPMIRHMVSDNRQDTKSRKKMKYAVQGNVFRGNEQ